MHMNIRLHQLNPVIGDIEGNVQNILSAMEKAEAAGAELLLLPELCTCGYSPMDLLERPAFREAIYRANQKITEASGETAVIFGTATPNQKKGRPCFNAALMTQNGTKIAEVHKALLPTYDVFNEDRYFERATSFECVEWNGRKLGITICEDIWANNGTIQYHTYALSPVKELAEAGADAIINLSASPFTVTKSESRERMLKDHADNIQRPIFYVNQVGANTELISDGDSMVLNSSAEVIARAPLFEEASVDVQWGEEHEVAARGSDSPVPLPDHTERIFHALCCGLKAYFEKTGVTSKAVLGLSGGIDSALVACIAAEALGAENVMAVAMPSEFSSEGSITDAEELAQNLGIEINQLPIKSIYNEYTRTLEPLFEGTEFGIAEENIQSRARGVLLMAIANKFDRFVLNTGNKSELATGYCTLYGDMNGAVAVISDLYKSEVFELSRWLNASYYGKEIIPQAIIEKPPSAELRPDQKDSDSLPDYNKLDTMLKLYVEEQRSASEIEDQGFEKGMVEKVIQLVDRTEYKRYQAPPGLKIHDKSFGSGRRWPLVQNW
jgi:NAD+ synthetase